MRMGKKEPVRPGTVVQGYRVERKLGEGGFAQVYLAKGAEREVALKFIRLEEAGEWAKRELSILLYLRHPNVVKLVGHVEGPEQAPGYLVLITEYVKGRTLYEWAKEENPSAREVARVVRELSRALAAVHEAGVLHRDFKGDNVLVRDEDGEPVLVDFGVSAVRGAPRVTPGGLAPCTPVYRSPECVRFLVDPERPVDAAYPHAEADDLYALGVTLYVLLTGVYPCWGRDELDLMREIALEVPTAPHERNRRVPRELGELCMRLLEKEPQARLASAREVGEALEAMRGEADASWEVPLGDGWDPASVPHSAPRGARGGVPSAVARGARLWAGGVCCLLLAGLGSAQLLLARGQRTEPPSTPVPAGPALAALLRAGLPDGGATSGACFVREVAPPWKPPEAGSGAAPPRAETPAPVVPVTTLRKGETLVKERREHPALVRREAKKGRSSELTLLCVGATAAACAGAPVRPQPARQPCPPGAVEVMSGRFGIPIGQDSPGLFLPGFDLFAGGKARPIPVREGPVTLYLGAPWGKLPDDTYLSGQLIIGPERVYGRITEARLPGGEMVPVCFAMVPQDSDERQGLPIEDTGGPGTVQVFPFVQVEAVESFE